MASEDELGGKLLERLLSDPAMRAEFRRDPVAAARRAGLARLADELSSVEGDPLQTLELRESRSSLAGVMMAAAVEAIALGGADDVQAAVGGPHVAEAASRAHSRLDPADYGMEGHGAPLDDETRALLHNNRVTLDADGIADLRRGRIDPRVVGLLTTLSHTHTLTISAMCSDHPRLSTGGSVSNHYYGRAFDIATVDGKPVGPGNEAARRIARSLVGMDPAIRPTEIGSPWQLPGPAYFTDAAHQNHLHVGYDDPIDRGWRGPITGEPVTAVDDGEEALEGDDDQGVEVDGDGGDADDGDGDDREDEDGGDQNDADDEDDGDAREDGGSGDTEAEADDESDGDGEDEDDEVDEDDEDDEDEDEDEDDPDDDEDEDEPDEDEPDEDEDEDDSNDGADEHDGSDGDGQDGDDGGVGSEEDRWQDPGVDVPLYPGADAPKEQIAAWMASAARRRGLPPELPIMASLAESGLTNLNFGDADSVGFFQMRVGIWNQGDYAGYPEKPALQLDWFLDHAEAVKRQRIAAGLPVDDPRHYGDWIADVERPATQYRGRYQLRLVEARELLDDVRSRQPAVPGSHSEVVKLRLITPEEARRARENGRG
jgi:hypothetical protein